MKKLFLLLAIFCSVAMADQAEVYDTDGDFVGVLSHIWDGEAWNNTTGSHNGYSPILGISRNGRFLGIIFEEQTALGDGLYEYADFDHTNRGPFFLQSNCGGTPYVVVETASVAPFFLNYYYVDESGTTPEGKIAKLDQSVASQTLTTVSKYHPATGCVSQSRQRLLTPLTVEETGLPELNLPFEFK